MMSLIILVVALFDRLLIGPMISRMTAIDQDIVKEESAIKQDIHFLAYKEKILKESKVLDAYIKKDIPAEEEIIAGFLKKLEILASKANVTLIKVMPSSGIQEKDYIKYQADLECLGKLADVATFMHLVDSSKDLTKVISFHITSKKTEDDTLKTLMSVVQIVIGNRPKSEGDSQLASLSQAQPVPPAAGAAK